MSTETIYRAMRKAMGNVPGPDGGLEDTWRMAKAEGIAAAVDLIEFALEQAFTDGASVAIPRWEEALGLVGDGEFSEDEYDGDFTTRLAAIAAADIERSLCDFPTLEEDLQLISPFLSLSPPDSDIARVQQFGKFFGMWSETLTPMRSASFADAYVWRVRYELQGAELTIPPSIKTLVSELMHARIAAWETYELGDTGTAFYLDGGVDGTSHLDQTPIY